MADQGATTTGLAALTPREVLGWVMKGEVALALGVVGIVVLLILPVPPLLLDLLLATSLLCSVLILMTSLLIRRPLDFTSFPTVLLASGDSIGAEAILLQGSQRQAAAPASAPAGLVGRTMADVERDLILETLKHCLGNRTHAANILGISIRTLRNKLNEYADGGIPITPAGAGDYHRAAVG